MTEKIIIAGSGGQGIMLLGKVLADAVMKENKFVTWLPSYGAEVRGGTSHCMVIISDREISSPFIEKADTILIMNQPSFDKFKNRLKNRGLLIINSSLVSKTARGNAFGFRCPFSGIAQELGNIKVANMVALGYLISKKNIVKIKSIFQTIVDFAGESKRDLIEINKKALEEGVRLR
jgi:2-oxoglutarate ferredoxin oxidoreductase subunit gamma